MKLAVVGGGIAGLAAAFEAARRGGAEVVVHEASDRFGGKLRTSRFAGRLVDEGADAFLLRVPEALALCRELGIAGDLVSPATGVAYIWSRGELRRIPPGTVLGVPVDLDAASSTGIVEGPIPHRPGGAPLAPEDDVSVGELIRAQLGDEVLERLVDPLIGGINAGDCDRLSVRACAPQIAAAAERDPDLVAGLRAAPSAAPGPVFASPAGGMGALAQALVDALRSMGTDLRTGSAIGSLEEVDADEVVLATPACVTAALLAPAAPQAAATLGAIEHASVTLVSFAFPAAAVARPLDASGFLVPRPEGLLLSAASWATTKWAHLGAPDGTAIVRASAGRAGDDRAAAMTDDEVVAALLDDLRLTMDVVGEPAEVRVSRWERCFPQYAPGHLARVDAIEAEVAVALPHVRLAGAAYRGLGVPACIRQGRAAAAPRPRAG